MYMERIWTLPEEVWQKENVSCTRHAIALSALLLLQGCWEKTYTPIETTSINFDQSFIESWTISYGTWLKINCWNTAEWQEDNIALIDNGIQITYPAGSGTLLDAKNNLAPLWGMNAICPLPNAPEEATAFSINYTIGVPEWFDTGKGMKLFGICGQDCPRGGNTQGQEWNSLRIHSYDRSFRDIFAAYIYGDAQTNGEKEFGTTHESRIRFKPGEYEIEIFIDYADGSVKVSIWEDIIYNETRQDFIIPYNSDSKKWWNLFLSSFYGWNPNWWPKQNTHLNFTNFNFTFYQ